MKPLIGISVNYKEQTSRIADAYVLAVEQAGGIPLLIPLSKQDSTLEATIEHLDALLLSGGGDMASSYYHEEAISELGDVDASRDHYDWILMTLAVRYQLPILGICRGMQGLNVLFGGSLFQDIYAQNNQTLLTHSQLEPREQTTHSVTITKNSKLAKILGTDTLEVNTFHHQAVKAVAPNFIQTATSPDGICEAIESEFYPIIGVQWHPENLAIADIEAHKSLFSWLINEASLYQKAKSIHADIISIDSHCDTPMVYTEGMNLGERTDNALVDFVKMSEGKLDTTFMVAYIPQEELTPTNTQKATDLAFEKLNLIHTQVAKNKDKALIAKTVDDIRKAKKMSKKAVIPALENGYAIGTDLSLVEKFYQAGVRYITLCHNGDNEICDSAARSKHTHNGLSKFGKEVIQEMNRLGIMVDLSHADEKSFWDALDLSQTPIIASHSSARALCDHPRNLNDNQLKALATNGGVCQVCLYTDFLTKNGEASVKTAVAHIKHIVTIAGINHVGIGTDFDGGGTIQGCRASNELINLTKELIREGFSQQDIRQIWGENFLRVMHEVETFAKR